MRKRRNSSISALSYSATVANAHVRIFTKQLLAKNKAL
jgi:hypothetical protein